MVWCALTPYTNHIIAITPFSGEYTPNGSPYFEQLSLHLGLHFQKADFSVFSTHNFLTNAWFKSALLVNETQDRMPLDCLIKSTNWA
jgi:hypothetical protein